MIETCKHCGTERTCSVARRRAAQAEYQRKRRQDPEFRAAKNERGTERKRERYRSDPEYRAAKNERKRKRYQSDPEFRAAAAERTRAHYHERKAETVARMLAMLNSGELAVYGAEPYFLYRFYDEDGALLYVGITNDPERRLYQHTAQKPWADDIARTEYAVLPNKTAATAAEAALIKELGPLHNVVHNKIPLTTNRTGKTGSTDLYVPIDIAMRSSGKGSGRTCTLTSAALAFTTLLSKFR